MDPMIGGHHAPRCEPRSDPSNVHVRRRGFLPLAAVVDAISTFRRVLDGCGDWAVDWRTAGVSAFFPRVSPSSFLVCHLLSSSASFFIIITTSTHIWGRRSC